jgi:16S rRNA (guanine966-N2)-methyltransferase
VRRAAPLPGLVRRHSNHMRISGGSAGGRILKVPQGLAVRPTPDLVKQAIFNSLGGRVAGARVLELFAGSGALGLECLSRAADSLLSVEKSPKHAEFIRKNVAAVGIAAARLELRVHDAYVVVHQLAEAGRLFDLILADPPYGEKNVGRRSNSFAQQLLDNEHLPKLLTPDGLFVLGHTKRDTLTMTAPWEERKVMKHGDTVMRFLRLAKKEAPKEHSLDEPAVD